MPNFLRLAHLAAGPVAGRDQEVGGTWLGLGADGRFAALTNIRELHWPPARKSRGGWWRGFLADVNGRSTEYTGIKLLVETRGSVGRSVV